MPVDEVIASPAATPSRAEGGSLASTPALHDGRALIVEDCAAVGKAIAAHMRLHGFATERAVTLAEAREALSRFSPAVISVDLNLPDGHGFDFVREAQAFGVEHVIIISGERQRDNVIATLECRVLHYLIKPMRLSELLRALLSIKASLASEKRDAATDI